MSWKLSLIPALVLGLVVAAGGNVRSQPPVNRNHMVGPRHPGRPQPNLGPGARFRVVPRPLRRRGLPRLRRPLPPIHPRSPRASSLPPRLPLGRRDLRRRWLGRFRHGRPPVFRPRLPVGRYSHGGHLFPMPWDLDRVRMLLRADPMAVRRRNLYGETLLHLAVKQNRPGLVRVLLAHGAFINARTRYGATPLHYAAYFGRPRIARMLIRHGANVNARDRWSRTALQVAAQRRKMNVFVILRRILGGM